MNHKKILLLIALAVLLGVPILGVIQTVLRRTPSQFEVTPMMGSTASFVGAEPADSVTMMEDGFVSGDDRVIVKSATLALIVTDIRQTVDQISEIVKNNGGYVTSSNVFQNNWMMREQARIVRNESLGASMSLRVPAEKLDGVLAQLRQQAVQVTQDTTVAQDQTKQKVDLDARLKNLQSSETQLQTIMKQAKTVQETLLVQQQLNTVQSQIEVLTAQSQNLAINSAMASISLTLTTKDADQPIVSPQQSSVLDEAKLALKDAARAYRSLFIAGMRVFILVLPLLILAGVAWLVWQRLRRKS